MFPENCNRCGLCCAMTVRLTEKDSARIRETGREEKDFAAVDRDGRKVLRHADSGFCIFFSVKDGMPHCGVYENRPQRCDDFPFTKRCAFGAHPIFRLSKNYQKLKKNLERQTCLKAPEK